MEITAAKLKLPVPDVKKIYDSIHKEGEFWQSNFINFINFTINFGVQF